MREIKFRAWDKLNYKWAYFTIGQVWGEVHLIVYHRIILDGGKFYQYTGLKDKNGKEIYEGDIFKYWWEQDANGEGGTTFHYDYLSVEFIGGCFWAGNETLSDFLKIDDEYELTGNIYENPELLK